MAQINITITDAQETRLLNVQDADGTKFDETCEHLFELGLAARERSIAAVAQRKLEAEAKKRQDAFNKLLACDPSIVSDPKRMYDAMVMTGMVNGIATAQKQQEQAA